MNNTTNSSYPVGMSCSGSEVGRAMKILFFVIITVGGIVGNALTICIVYRDKKLRNTVNALIVNMAISDLLIPLGLVKQIVNVAQGSFEWHVPGTGGVALCKLFSFMVDLSMPVSILSMVFITLDRFCAIVFPLRMNSGPKITAIFIFTSWAIPVAFFAPYLYGFKMNDRGYGLECYLQWDQGYVRHLRSHTIFTMFICVIYIIIPFIILVFCYTTILCVLRRQDQGVMARSQPRRERRIRYQKTKKVVLMALAIVVVFGLCYGPYICLLIMWTFVYHWRYKTTCGFEKFYFAAQFLANTNPALNPIIYFIFIERFGAGLRSMLRMKKAGCTSASSGRERGGSGNAGSAGTSTTRAATKIVSLRMSPLLASNS
ncbi:predicted protein [Nematostella vectensis]|uniref:G-protein coupled receptors family 1 profile domain-containing protein n=1 Tax=Nematostella vectensis TaxID=45351 RepID=A7SGW8_NEMVE|nr:predicted protein [Nematostella vectensis]|eukprot:XP_001629145.1 predicted protein [Nematostella vectensis]